MTATLRITVPMPPSANTYWRPAKGRGLVPSDEALAYKAQVRRLLAGVVPLFGEVLLTGIVYRARKSGDLSNRIKALEDALIGIAFLDDSQVSAIHLWRDDSDPGNARVDLELIGERLATMQEVKAAADAKDEARKKRRKTLRLNGYAKRLAVNSVRLTSAVRR